MGLIGEMARIRFTEHESFSIYDYIEKPDNGRQSQLRVRKGDNWGLINIFGQTLIPCVYDGCSCFSQNTIWFKRKDKWALFSISGKQLTSFKFEQISTFHNQFQVAWVKFKRRYGLINSQGQELTDFKYRAVGAFNNNKGTTWVETDNGYGSVNVKGEEVLGCNNLTFPIY